MTYDPSEFVDDGYGDQDELRQENERLKAELAAIQAPAETEQEVEAPQVDFHARHRDLVDAIGASKSREEQHRAIDAHNSFIREALSPPPPPKPIASMTPAEAREAVTKAGSEATSIDDLHARFREIGIMR